MKNIARMSASSRPGLCGPGIGDGQGPLHLGSVVVASPFLAPRAPVLLWKPSRLLPAQGGPEPSRVPLPAPSTRVREGGRQWSGQNETSRPQGVVDGRAMDWLAYRQGCVDPTVDRDRLGRRRPLPLAPPSSFKGLPVRRNGVSAFGGQAPVGPWAVARQVALRDDRFGARDPDGEGW